MHACFVKVSRMFFPYGRIKAIILQKKGTLCPSMNAKKKTTSPSIAVPHEDALLQLKTPLLAWYPTVARVLPWREEPTPYRVWISEIMLQQTRVAAVLPYFERFLKTLPDIAALASCPDDELMKLWQGLGYYSRARNLKKAAQVIVAEYGGVMPLDFETLLKLPGIGRYTAGAISSIAGHHPAPAVDGNVLRVVTRLTLFDGDVLKDVTKRAVENALRPIYEEGPVSATLNQALMELGATVCVPNGAPHCDACPLAAFCLARKEDCTADFPKKAAKKARRIEQMTVLRLIDEETGRLALRQRPKKGLLAGLYELPHLPGHCKAADVRRALFDADYPVHHVRRLAPARHVFSHVEWDMIAYEVTLAPATGVAEHGDALLWATPAELSSTYSIPSAFQYFLPNHA